MSQSLSKIIVHLVFSTKNRQPSLHDNIRPELHAYLIGILRNYDSPSIITNFTRDHGHILFMISKNQTLAKVVEEVKRGTSKWLKTKGPDLEHFFWQNGYGAFSVSQSDVEQVKAYISAQHEHHKIVSFQDELRALFRQHGMPFDERYIWD